MSLASLDWPCDEPLWCRWLRHAEREPDREAIAVLRAGLPARRWAFGPLVARAAAYAGWLRDAGVAPGQTCALISRHHEEFYPLYMGVVALGALPAVLAYPNARLHPDKFREGLSGMARHSGVDWILTEASLEETLRPLVADACNIRGVLLPYEGAVAETSCASAVNEKASSAAILQHSSGTTGLQKAVVLSHRAVLEHVANYGRAIQIDSADRIVSWLPLYHDMGLIAALHLPLALGIPVSQLDPFEWVMAPVLLIEALEHERGTLSWLPNFAYSLMGSRIRDDEVEGLSLQHVRLLINCSEPVRDESHRSLLNRLAACGLDPRVLGACYAMAEATFAVTQTAPGSAAPVVAVSREGLLTGMARDCLADEQTRACVSSGRPIAGCEVMIRAESGDLVGDNRVGEIYVRSSTLFQGYRNRSDLTEAALSSGWYRTGDLGFFRLGELFVVGRKKDLIIVAGKNLYPEDIEDAAMRADGVVPGRVVAFGDDDPATGTERVCVVLESELPDPEHPALKTRVVAAVQLIDVTLSDVYVVPPRWLVKSSSGKPSRSANRVRILAVQHGGTP